jgi:hypothetical protein
MPQNADRLFSRSVLFRGSRQLTAPQSSSGPPDDKERLGLAWGFQWKDMTLNKRRSLPVR